MATSFEILDDCDTALGELMLRRRKPVSMPDTWIYEVKLDGHFLMSSLVRKSEEELVHLALPRLDGGDWRVLVGGLGLGYTAAAALASADVDSVEVVEFLPEVIAWHEGKLVPMSAQLLDDERCSLIRADCFEWIRTAPTESFDAVLIDIDDGPDELLSQEHASFYSVNGLGDARWCLRPGGVFGLWTSRECNEHFLENLRRAFGNGDAEEVHFHNPLLSIDEVNTIYLAQA